MAQPLFGFLRQEGSRHVSNEAVSQVAWFVPVHPAAAAIDIGAALHVAAVGPDRDKEPVRTFQTFTDDLHRLADWFAQCGIRTVVMKSTGFTGSRSSKSWNSAGSR